MEFKRYGYEKHRVAIGILEILGAVGLIVGLIDPVIFGISSAGLTILMFAAILVRKKIRDPLLKWLPAIFLFLINLYLFLVSLNVFPLNKTS